MAAGDDKRKNSRNINQHPWRTAGARQVTEGNGRSMLSSNNVEGWNMKFGEVQSNPEIMHNDLAVPQNSKDNDSYDNNDGTEGKKGRFNLFTKGSDSKFSLPLWQKNNSYTRM